MAQFAVLDLFFIFVIIVFVKLSQTAGALNLGLITRADDHLGFGRLSVIISQIFC